MFFFQKVRFSQHFPPKILFFVFDFCAIFAAISSKNLFFVFDFRTNFPSNFSLRGICLRKQRWGICMTHSPKRGKSAVFAEFHEFLSSPQFFFGVIFLNMWKKKCDFRRKYEKSWCVSFQKSAIFAAIWGQIKN